MLRASQWWTPTQHADYQLRQLRATLETAATEIPFYREHFAAHGVTPKEFVQLDDLRRFPTMDKRDVLASHDQLINPQLNRDRLMEFYSGGTSGSNVAYLFEESFRQREQAFIWRMWNTVGYRQGARTAILQGRECPAELNDGLWYFDHIANAVVLSAHRLTRDTAPRYLEAIERFQPKVLIAFPSLARLLAGHAEQLGWAQSSFELVLCGSETLYSFQRELLERVFAAPVRIHYGHTESAALFTYCECSSRYHVVPEYGFVEFLREDGSAAQPGEVGEIVATSFDNRAMPFVRYRTGDYAEVGSGQCECGRNYPLVESVHGRRSEFLRTRSGREYSPIMLEYLIDGLAGFDDLQLIQEQIDAVTVRVVPAADFDEAVLAKFVANLEKYCEHELRVTVERVADIPRTQRQKKQMVISNL
ncbi:MAG: phenylacetate--CoA ligase family protein [bacterium]|nr:phenylacetate--CoA ligase family protein [bacterium]